MTILRKRFTAMLCSFIVISGITQPFGISRVNASQTDVLSYELITESSTYIPYNDGGDRCLYYDLDPSIQGNKMVYYHEYQMHTKIAEFDPYLLNQYDVYYQLEYDKGYEGLEKKELRKMEDPYQTNPTFTCGDLVNKEGILLDSGYVQDYVGYKVYFYKKIKNEAPRIYPFHEDRMVSHNGTIRIEGTAIDPDTHTDHADDKITISAELNGVRKETTIDTNISQVWALEWHVDELPDGVYKDFKVIGKDQHGEQGEETYYGTITVDRQAPSAPEILPATSKWVSQSVPVTIKPGIDDHSGIAYTEYKLTNTYGDIKQDWTKYTGEFNITEQGSTYIQARSVDKAGLITDAPERAVYIDQTPPESPQLRTDHNEWTPNNVIITMLHGSDSEASSPTGAKQSGPKKSEYSVDGGPWKEYITPFEIAKEGISRIVGRTIDNVGLIGPESEMLVYIDRTASTAPKLESKVGTDNNVTVTLEHGIDAHGVKKSEWSIDGQTWNEYTGPIELTKDGVTRVQARTIDKAGNVSALSELMVKIDRTDPTIVIDPMKRTWHEGHIPIVIHYKDDQGIDENNRFYAVTNSPAAPLHWTAATKNEQELTITNEGVWYVHAKVTDLAGNTQQMTSQELQLQSLPVAPNLKIDSAEENKIKLSWNLPGNVLTDGYQYFIENMTTGQVWNVAYPTNTLIDSTISPGNEYQYRVMAKNHSGSSAFSSPVSAKTIPTAPKQLTLYSIERDPANANVYFESVPLADKYHISVIENVSQQAVFENTVTSATYHPVNNLQPGRYYTVKVAAENSAGRGAAATASYLSLPSAPGKFSTLQIYNDGVHLNWDSVTTATYYDLKREQLTIYNGNELSFRDRGLASETEYNYFISAINQTGTGQMADLLNVVTLPSRISGIRTLEYGSDHLIIEWDSLKGTSTYSILVDGQVVGNTPATTFEVKDLNPGERYKISVRPENRSGHGEEVSTSLKTIPAVVEADSMQISNINETKAVLTWKAATGADKYRVKVGDREIETSDTELEVTGLNAGQHYKVNVAAGNESGYSPNTSASFLTLPSQVGVIKAIEDGQNLKLSWEPTPSAKTYVIKQEGKEIGIATNAEWTVKSLKQGGTYRFTIQAVNETGIGAETPFVWVMRPGMDNQQVVMKEISENSVKIDWEDAAGADGYRVYQGGNLLVETKDSFATLTGLESAKRYKDIVLVPFNSTGEGSIVKVPSFDTLPSGDLKVDVDAAQSQITYHFKIGSKNEMIIMTKDNKEVYRGKEKTFTLQNLKPDTDIQVEVWTENESGDRSKVQMIKSRTAKSSDTSSNTGNGESSTEDSSSTNDGDNKPSDGNDNKVPDEQDNNKEEQKIEDVVFKDIEGLYNKNKVLSLYDRGIIAKPVNGLFEPHRAITRAEFMTFIVKTLGLEEKGSSTPMAFKDIESDAWYYRTLRIAHDHGVIKGFSKTEFRPNTLITREQAARMIGSLMEKHELKGMAYRDTSNISSWAMTDVQLLSAAEIVKGYPDGTFRPKQNVTRAEAASIIYNFFEVSKK
ncbi:fibronectin type III domain-containing protein [Paenibacillus agilis]|uniref:S-layer protein n=1 Tax=Paenibacillus agilis TaxID=3020863 RepID=A0A559IDA6_9BACL|nr:S-layer homology domain-containing protein [Paenibacillus agilis]TVX85606.1 hypothetical protein FPZ44_24955 [Paenibacillus agilis]